MLHGSKQRHQRQTKRQQRTLPLIFLMISTISWNIRGMKAQKVSKRLKTLKLQHNLTFVALQEPMTKATKIRRFQNQLGIQNSYFNCNNKIWFLWTNDHVVNILEDTEQHVTISISHHMGSTKLHLTVVYAKCKAYLRQQLWIELRAIADRIQGSWGVVGDFNVITDSIEKKGGRPYRVEKSIDFLACIDNCGLQDTGYYGAIYTRSDNRGAPNTIWKRLDRLLINMEWSDEFSETTAEHLSRVCSDHAPLLINLKKSLIPRPKYFKFLDFWTKHDEFLTVVQEEWLEPIQGNALWILHQKLKKITKWLSAWSRQAFGDICEEPKRLEKQMNELEAMHVADATPSHIVELNEAKAKYIQYLKIQEEVL
ncbi:hypothetical protein A4A49_25687 [Nicotiana attenuata]|uniref:Endonuclease/exonuclease/phosphatase domain-containing protein n=1 Tax=Nicotiana attenuata TaxID=49451 RepID=A0A1J6HU24_NICAT|nr:hypothetical protein A4A49_25687 [Nicotiana attenuata]